MWRAGRIALLLGIVVGGAVATWQIVDVRNDAGETVSTAEDPLPTPVGDEPPLDEFLEIAPSLSGDRQMEVLGVATMVVAVTVDGTILFVEHHPVGADGGLVAANDLSPPDQQPVLVTDADGKPVFTDNGDVLVRIGDDVIEMAPGSPEG